MFYADLHIHSKYSRATSKDCNLEQLALWGAKKGLSLIATGDFTHPEWFLEIQNKLQYLGNGIFKLKDEIEKEVFKNYQNLKAPNFILSVEISTIYKRFDKTRKVHHVVFSPDIESASKLRLKLESIGNIKSDGRPILGLNSRDLLEIVLESNPDSYIIPAHIWTPWFSVLGSKSGYDSIEDCYEDLAENIFALETGLSSDPYMNWRVSKLDKYRLVSNSDAHSPSKLAREATVFSINPDYYTLKNALKTGNGYIGTVEFFPEEGKYHQDGHRKCGVCLDSSETKKLGGICPICHKPLTIGVSYRVEELADRKDGEFKPQTAGEVYSLVPLNEILSEIMMVGSSSKKVELEYERLIQNFGSELDILQNIDLDLVEKDSPILKEALLRLREGKVIKQAGYDGEYGIIKLFEEGEVRDFYNFKLKLNLAPQKREKRKEYEKSIEQYQIKAENNENIIMPDLIQKEAISDDSQHILIKAGPGSGKTSVLTRRIERLVLEKKIIPNNILAVTFSKKAANEMNQRLALKKIEGVSIHTFHSFCFELLKEKGSLINLDKNFKIITQEEKILYNTNSSNTITFDELITLTIKLLKEYDEVRNEYQRRFEYIFIDEYQDIDCGQYELIKLLVSEKTNIFAIGDKNQAIYGFRGGSAEYFDRFCEDFKNAKIITLLNNYRSSSNIVNATNAIVDCSGLKAKLSKNNTKITIHKAPTPNAEAEFVVSTIERLIGGDSFFSMDSKRAFGFENDNNYSYGDFAVLYRTKTQLEPLITALNRKGAPYANFSDELLCSNKEIRNLLKNLNDEDSPAIQIENSQNKNNIEDNIFQYLLDLSKKFNSKEEFIHEVSFLRASDTLDKRADRINLMTLHSSKGLEFKCVFIIGVEDNILPFYLAKNDEEKEEEKRLLYVGMTRAQNELYLSHCEKRLIKGEFKNQQISPYLAKIKQDLLSYSKFEKIYKKEEAKQLKLF